jgi:hypothetical protein
LLRKIVNKLRKLEYSFGFEKAIEPGERGLPICGLRPNHETMYKSMTFPTPHIGHWRHGLFFTRWIVNPMLNLLKRTMTYPGFESGTFGLAVSIANHYTI